jgi:6,7-dimethyl-8-ribityllumazine synthase
MNHAATGKQIAFVQACWHRDIVDQGRDAFLAEMKRHGIGPERIDLYEVPGSLEIPLQAKLLAKTGKYASIVAAGFVVDGGIYRHEFVAQTVLDAIMRIQLDTDVPIISMVLTPQHFHEHDAHHDFFHGHFKVKGAEAAQACLKTLENLSKVLA